MGNLHISTGFYFETPSGQMAILENSIEYLYWNLPTNFDKKYWDIFISHLDFNLRI